MDFSFYENSFGVHILIVSPKTVDYNFIHIQRVVVADGNSVYYIFGSMKTSLPEFELVHVSVILVDRIEHKYLQGQMREPLFQQVCNGNIRGNDALSRYDKVNTGSPKCHFVHHFSPTLKLGPFHLEAKLYYPFRTVLHNFFTDKEMDWMMKYSKPRLSASRSDPHSTTSQTKADMRYSKNNGYTVSKAVTTWIDDITYNETQKYVKISSGEELLAYEHPPLIDPYIYTVKHDILYAISRRIELATNFNVTTRHGSSQYQTTNYGLAGMVVSHSDPWGYEQGVKLVEDRKYLTRTGDYIATFMGWFEDTPAGGNTAFLTKESEGTVQPTKGSAAFWMNLSSCHAKDARSFHGGCPVLKGSKWIINKWINSWDQWKNFPCYLEPYQTIRPFKGMSS